MFGHHFQRYTWKGKPTELLPLILFRQSLENSEAYLEMLR